MVKPGLLSSVMLDTIQVFLPVVHVVLKGPVTVVAVVSLPHGPSYMFRTGMCHTLHLWGTEIQQKVVSMSGLTAWWLNNCTHILQQLPILYRIIPKQCHSLYVEQFFFWSEQCMLLRVCFIGYFWSENYNQLWSWKSPVLQTPCSKCHHNIMWISHCRFDLEIKILPEI